MSELYDYLLTTYKVIVGLITTKRLVVMALCAFAFYLVWICIALFLSFQRKFSKNCIGLYNFIRKNQLDSTNLHVIDMKADKISSGFSHGWKKFKSSANAKPSDFITRREALDVEVSGGVLNQGKTFMKSFISIATAVLFVFNLAYLGNDATITSYLIAETLVLPLIFYIVMKLFYFLYTSIKQQLYKQDIECFYDLITLLDDVFGSSQVNPQLTVSPQNIVVQQDGEEVVGTLEPKEQVEGEELVEGVEETTAESEEEINPLDRYDVFKKKNIDVDKIINEVPKNSGTNLPYINVDSDYVIKDDENKETLKIVGEDDTATSILGGMMQDRAGMKKNSDSFIDVDKPIAEIDENKIAEMSEESQAEEEKEADPFGSLEQFTVAENNIEVAEDEESSTEEKVEEPVEEKTEEAAEEKVEKVAEEKTEDVEPVEVENSEAPIVHTDDDEVSDEEKENIAMLVSGFKKNRSTLASGGVVIERNEPIARRERPTIVEDPVREDPMVDAYGVEDVADSYYPKQVEVNRLDVHEDDNRILNSLKSSAGGYDPGYQAGYNAQYGAQTGYNQGYGYQGAGAYVPPVQPNYTNPYMNTQSSGYGYQGVYTPNPYTEVNQNSYNQNYDNYQEAETDFEDEYDDEEVEEVVVQKPAKKNRTKEEEPRPRNLRKKETKVAEVEDVKKSRGRPKKQVIDETMTIKNDKEFDEVLSRAEKRMRKSEEGLSASQSKRIEKELKTLMDAMNKYKENK